MSNEEIINTGLELNGAVAQTTLAWQQTVPATAAAAAAATTTTTTTTTNMSSVATAQQQHINLTQSSSLPALPTQQLPIMAATTVNQKLTKAASNRSKSPNSDSGSSISNSSTMLAGAGQKGQKPYIRITEQPISKGLRFRYECEGRSAGSIPGARSTPDCKTYPTVEIVGFKGEVVLVVSCVTKDAPYRPHPHKLVGKDGLCKDGIYTVKLTQEPLRCQLSNVGIQCVKKRDIRASLEEREKRKVDPFNTKFGHKDQPSSIDLNVVRLCFQAFIRVDSGIDVLEPVVSEPIFEKKAHNELIINRLCSCSAKVGGGDEIIMLCDKVTKEDIKIRFYEIGKDEKLIWEDYADFQQSDVHKQTAIAFKTPRYHSPDVRNSAKVYLQLVRPSDGASSEAIPFEYYPDPDQLKRKRLKIDDAMGILERELQKYEQFNKMNNYRDDSPIHLQPSVTLSFASSPTYVSEIKAESIYHDMDSHSSTSTSPFPHAHHTYPTSPASFTETSTLGMQKAQLQPQNLNLNVGNFINFNQNQSCSPSINYSGGSITPINNHITEQNMNLHNSFATIAATTTTNYQIQAAQYQQQYVSSQQQQLQQQQQQESMQYNLSDLIQNANGDDGPSLSGLLAGFDADELLSGLSLKDLNEGVEQQQITADVVCKLNQ